MNDMYNNVALAQSIKAQAATTTVNGTGVDLQGYRGAVVVIDLGTFGGTTPSATLKVQESSDNSAFTDVAAADLQGGQPPTIDTTSDDQILKRGYLGTKQYLRGAITAMSGTSPSLPISVSVVRGDAIKQPV